MNKKLGFLSLILVLGVVGCGNNQNPSPKPTPIIGPEDDTVDVFVLSGQSNMEGSTYWYNGNNQLLENYMDSRDLDFQSLKDGLPNVLTSYYGFYYPNGWTNANSSSENKETPEGRMEPNFLPTTVGMGVNDVPGKFMGPEVGLAYTLNEYATEDRPIYLIKCAFSGSGFIKTDGPNWSSREDDPTKSLFYLLKTYTQNCLDAIEETGRTPVLKGFLWHQGESDGGDPKYREYTENLIGDFRDLFKSYAVDEEGDNIAFIDCTIYDGEKMQYGTAANRLKLELANESDDDLNFCIDAGWTTENGLKLDIGGYEGDSEGGYNIYHYNTKDCYILGEAYAQIILDNDLLNL